MIRSLNPHSIGGILTILHDVMFKTRGTTAPVLVPSGLDPWRRLTRDEVR
jgi:hypothetical protein